MTRIAGDCSARFAPVEDAFRANFEDQGEVGAALSIYLRGEKVVDLWGGVADRESGRPWSEDTLALVFSATKGVTAACIHLLVERGVLDLDAPIARYWPEFAVADKDRVLLRHVLSHRAGLPVVEAELSRAEVLAWEPVVKAIAAQTPRWEPGSRHGYHVRTFGWILGEVVRRVTGVTLGQFFAREIARPLALELYIGLPGALEPRVASLIMPAPPTDPAQLELIERFMGPGSLMERGFNHPGDLAYGPAWNSREIHAAEIPSSNGITTARALARFYSALIGEVDGTRVLRPETVAVASSEQSNGPDALLLLPTRFALGFMLPPALNPECGPGGFGHPGAGGSLAFADPETGVSFAYVMNQLKFALGADERPVRLVRALYRSLV